MVEANLGEGPLLGGYCRDAVVCLVYRTQEGVIDPHRLRLEIGNPPRVTPISFRTPFVYRLFFGPSSLPRPRVDVSLEVWSDRRARVGVDVQVPILHGQWGLGSLE